MNEALAYLQKVHDAVIASAGTGTPDPMDLCRRTAKVLGLPPQAVTPLLARTFAANLRARAHKDLLAP